MTAQGSLQLGTFQQIPPSEHSECRSQNCYLLPVSGQDSSPLLLQASQIGHALKKQVLELGGSDPFLVLATDDLDTVVAAATTARLDTAGQSCNGAKRFIVVDGLYAAGVMTAGCACPVVAALAVPASGVRASAPSASGRSSRTDRFIGRFPQYGRNGRNDRAVRRHRVLMA